MSVVVVGGFDDIRSRQIRFLEEAARMGSLHVLLWSDEAFRALEGRSPKFPEEERRYVLEAVRFVDRVTVCPGPAGGGMPDRDALPPVEGIVQAATRTTWAVDPESDTPRKRAHCASRGLAYRPIPAAALEGYPDPTSSPAGTAAVSSAPTPSDRKRVIVTGCYDWFHSGHVRFFEEVSELGDVYAVVGHDANVRLLKGEGHPLFSQEERRYMVGCVRYVKEALISTGHGWLDAEPEIRRLRPHIYAVNEDGDKPEKREYCEKSGIEYVVLKRLPRPGLPRRQSTELRGF